MDTTFKNKTIILAITPDINIYKCFVDNLEFLGFKVHLICNTEKFKYKNIFQRINNVYRKTFLKDKFYKRESKRLYFKEKNLNQLKNIGQVDCTLTIRADLFDEAVLKEITSKSTNNIAYQWDGLDRFPEVKDVISIFDKFFVFDKNDLNRGYKTYFTTNFYFDCYFSDKEIKQKKPEFDAYFIGSYDDRINKLMEICSYLTSYDLKLNIILCSSPVKKLQKYSYISFIKERLSNLENLKLIKNAKIIIDLHYDKLHTGLSFRTFDAIGNHKKIITLNKNLMDYDFYNERNIYVLNESKISFEDFINSEYDENQDEITKKYGFTNWIKYMLNEGDFEMIKS